MTDEPREPASSEHPTGPEAMDQATREVPALAVPPPDDGPGEPPELAPASGPAPPPPASSQAPAPREASSEPAGSPATPPDLWSSPARPPPSGGSASPAPELDKAPRVEPGPAPAEAASGGGFDPDRVISTARNLTEKPEVLLGAAFCGGVLLAIIIRRLGS